MSVPPEPVDVGLLDECAGPTLLICLDDGEGEGCYLACGEAEEES